MYRAKVVKRQSHSFFQAEKKNISDRLCSLNGCISDDGWNMIHRQEHRKAMWEQLYRSTQAEIFGEWGLAEQLAAPHTLALLRKFSRCLWRDCFRVFFTRDIWACMSQEMAITPAAHFWRRDARYLVLPRYCLQIAWIFVAAITMPSGPLYCWPGRMTMSSTKSLFCNAGSSFSQVGCESRSETTEIFANFSPSTMATGTSYFLSFIARYSRKVKMCFQYDWYRCLKAWKSRAV